MYSVIDNLPVPLAVLFAAGFIAVGIVFLVDGSVFDGVMFIVLSPLGGAICSLLVMLFLYFVAHICETKSVDEPQAIEVVEPVP